MKWHVTDIQTVFEPNYKGRGDHLIIAPSDLYPPMIEHIQAVVDNLQTDPDGQLVIPIMPEIALAESDIRGAKNLISWAHSIPSQAWEDALTPFSEFADLPADNPRRVARGQALDCALGWFVRALRMECRRNNVPVPNRIITYDLDYRL